MHYVRIGLSALPGCMSFTFCVSDVGGVPHHFHTRQEYPTGNRKGHEKLNFGERQTGKNKEKGKLVQKETPNTIDDNAAESVGLPPGGNGAAKQAADNKNKIEEKLSNKARTNQVRGGRSMLNWCGKVPSPSWFVALRLGLPSPCSFFSRGFPLLVSPDLALGAMHLHCAALRDQTNCGLVETRVRSALAMPATLAALVAIFQAFHPLMSL